MIVVSHRSRTKLPDSSGGYVLSEVEAAIDFLLKQVPKLLMGKAALRIGEGVVLAMLMLLMHASFCQELTLVHYNI
jgi:hypothetical protein